MSTLLGTALDDIIIALGGNDHADGGSGNDTILGGAARDTIVGGLGNDSLSGEDGDDVLFGGAGKGHRRRRWRYVGRRNQGDGSDTITGGSGVDTAVVNGGDTAGDTWALAAGGMGRLVFPSGRWRLPAQSLPSRGDGGVRGGAATISWLPAL